MSKEVLTIETKEDTINFIKERAELKDGRRTLAKVDTVAYFKARGFDEDTQKAYKESNSLLLDSMVALSQEDLVNQAKVDKRPLSEQRTEVRVLDTDMHRKALSDGENTFTNPRTKEVVHQASSKVTFRQTAKLPSMSDSVMGVFRGDVKDAFNQK